MKPIILNGMPIYKVSVVVELHNPHAIRGVISHQHAADLTTHYVRGFEFEDDAIAYGETLASVALAHHGQQALNDLTLPSISEIEGTIRAASVDVWGHSVRTRSNAQEDMDTATVESERVGLACPIHGERRKALTSISAALGAIADSVEDYLNRYTRGVK